GDSLMVAPIYEPNKRGRYVYIPEEMALWKVKEYNKIELDIINKGHHYIDVDLNEIPVFIRKDKLFTISDSAQSTEKLSMKNLKVVGFVENGAEYKLYTDDGISKDMRNSKEMLIKVWLEKDELRVETENKLDEVKNISFNIITKEGFKIKNIEI
ncbi:MAG: TIM-barrel domain-containing protein, partial [Clostridium sp.]